MSASTTTTLSNTSLVDTMRHACKLIAPVWSLENFVAVNPYLGYTDKPFGDAAKDLAAAGGVRMTLPLEFYLKKMEEGRITEDHITAALKRHNVSHSTTHFINAAHGLNNQGVEMYSVASFADIATQSTDKNWNRFALGRITSWAASYFDNGQAAWNTSDHGLRPFAAWKKEASIDKTTELNGLVGFREIVRGLPTDPVQATEWALEKLALPEQGRALYLHRLLVKHGGWSAFAARQDWESNLYGRLDGVLMEFLAILACLEAALLVSLGDSHVETKWNEAKEILSIEKVQDRLNTHLEHHLIFQEAFDLSYQERLIQKFTPQPRPKADDKKLAPKAQAIFCIDVRSEVFRRNLEQVDARIETLGFAGFFGFPISYVRLGHESGEASCPVLLPTGPVINEQLPDPKAHKRAVNKRIASRALKQTWKSFKSSAVSNFSFVSPLGMSYLPKIFTDSFGLTRPVPHPNKTGLSKAYLRAKSIDLTYKDADGKTQGIPVDQQITMAKNALTAMSLTKDFAPFVLITGHGSSMVNNPHATGYDCGACGGHSGDGNARVAAAVLNQSEVREALEQDGIVIPSTTTFLACLHDTTTDELTILNEADVSPEAQNALDELKTTLKLAGSTSRQERASRMHISPGASAEKEVLFRSKDWSQTRPEWGLAGCSAFVVAPRSRTKDINLEGQSFLHSYNWEQDQNFGVLEAIMTAPMVVTSWINLQYYGSAVDNTHMGSGNKTLHNVTAGIGVLEGYSGDLRTGLPWQAVHDGDDFQHEPIRLNVIIEAPLDAITGVLEKHASVKNLCDHGWIQLLAMDEYGTISHRYSGNLTWESLRSAAA